MLNISDLEVSESAAAFTKLKNYKHLIPGVLHKGVPFSCRILVLFESKTFVVFKDCLLQYIFFFVKYVEYKLTY